MRTIFGHLLEILSIERARCTLEGPLNGTPMALFTVRPDPDEKLEAAILMLTPEQCVRIRDTLDGFLNDRQSWLFMPKSKQKEMRLEQSLSCKRRNTK